MKDAQPAGPKISVIVPVFNSARFLQQCLRSIMGQTFRGLEILVVDDASNDASVEIIGLLQAEDSRIRLFRHPVNRGQSDAQNTALLAATGEYVAYVDSDDYAEPDMLEKMLAATNGGEHAVVVCGYNVVDEIGTHIRSETFPAKVIREDEVSNPFQIANPASWNKLWRRSLYTDNGILFPEGAYYEDLATSPRLFAKARSIHVIEDCCYNYRAHAESTLKNFSDKHLLSYFRIFDALKSFFMKEGLYEKHRRALDTELRRHFFFQAWRIHDSTSLSIEKKAELYRHLLLLRRAYSEQDDPLRAFSAEQLYEQIRADRIDG